MSVNALANFFTEDVELNEALCNFVVQVCLLRFGQARSPDADRGTLVVQRSLDAGERNGRFVLAVTGDNALIRFARQVTKEPFLSNVDWQNWWVVFVDECCVPLTHPFSMYRLVADELLRHVSIPETQVFPAYDELSELDDQGCTCESAATTYEKQVTSHREHSVW